MRPVSRVALGLLAAQAVYAQGVIRTAVGTDWLFPAGPVPAVGAPLGNPAGLAYDSGGNLYIADPANAMVFRVDPGGQLNVFAGNGLRGYAGDEGPAAAATLSGTQGVAVDVQGNVYISELAGRIRRVTRDGIIHRFAGKTTGGSAPADGLAALDVRLDQPKGMSFDAQGNLYVTLGNGARVVKIDPRGVLTIVAGNGTPGFSGDGARATNASLLNPRRAVAAPDGSIYIADSGNNRIRRVTPDGIISTFAGNGEAGSIAGVGGPATQARIQGPMDVLVDPAGEVYLTTDASAILKVDAQGFLRVVTTQQIIISESGLVRSPAGEIIASEWAMRRVRRVQTDGTLTTIAGGGDFRVSAEGARAADTILSTPQHVLVDPNRGLLIADTGLHRVRRVAADGTVTTIAGNGRAGSTANGVQATATNLSGPSRLATDPAGNLYVVQNAIIRRIRPDGVISVFAGTGAAGFSGDGGPATQAAISLSPGLASDEQGNIYIADTTNHRIRRVGLDGTIRTVAGTGTAASTGDGGPALQAALNNPQAVTVSGGQNLYVAENNGRVRRITSDFANVTTVGAAGFGGVTGIVRDAADNIYLVSPAANKVALLSPDGRLLSTIGTGTQGFRGDGGPPSAAFLNLPNAVALDSTGRLYIADTSNNRIRVVETTKPTFDLSSTSLVFTANSGGVAPPEQSFDVTGSTDGLAFIAAVTTASGGSWLSVLPAGGQTPARLRVSVNPAGLAAGVYQGQITITAAAADPSVKLVTVRFTVESAAAPALVVEPAGLTFHLEPGSAPATQQVRVENTGGGSLTFNVAAGTAAGGGWLSVSPGIGAARPGSPVFLTVTANPGPLAAGVYSGRVTITAAGFPDRVIAVTLTISSTPRRIVLSQTGLTFTAVVGGGTPPPQTFLVLNGGAGTLSWTAESSTRSGGPWLSISSTGGSSAAGAFPRPVEVRVLHAGLAAGEYYGRIDVRGDAGNSPQSVLVVLQVLPAGQNPGPVVQPTGLVFTGVAGAESSPSSQVVTISNLTSQSQAFNSGVATLAGGAWLSLAPPSGTVRPSEPFRIVVQPDTEGMASGVYPGALTLVFEDRSVRTVALLLVLAPGPSSQAAPAFSRAAGGCAPDRLLPLFTTLGQDFAVPAAWPVAIEARVVDNCGAAMTSGSVVASFSNGDPPLALAPAGDGSWSATWASRLGAVGDVSVTINAETPATQLRGSVTVRGGLKANPNPPRVLPGGVLSAASFELQAPLAPGSFVTIFGSRLSEGLSVAEGLPWALQRNGTEVILAGRSLPLYFTSDGQVNAVIPYGLEVNTSHQLIVQRGPMLSMPEPLTIAAARPAVFAVNNRGFGQGHVYRVAPGVQELADSAHAVRAGDVIVIYCAGLGPVNPSVEAGHAAPFDPLAVTTNSVSLTIGGQPANVFFAGLTPGFAGLYQVNAFVPEGATAGTEVPVILTVAGQSSPPVTMAVR